MSKHPEMNSITFPLERGGEPLLATCAFATQEDIRAISSWAHIPRANDPMDVRDASEYAGIAADKWRFYRRSKRLASSVDQLRQVISAEPEGEFAFLLVVRAEWHRPSRQVGFCLVRRTWAHNFCVDFLASDPRQLRPGTRNIRGIGTGLLYAVMCLGEELSSGRIWGEATSQSVRFYRKQFRQSEILDQFSVGLAEQWHFMEKTRKRWSGADMEFRLSFSL